MASDAPMTASPAPPTSAPPRERLSDKQLVELLELTRGADSVELKLTIPLDRQRSTVFELGMDPLDAQIRMVYFFDTPNLDLDKAGVIVRGRRIQGKPDDTVVKLRPVSPQNLPDSLRYATGFVVEVDAMPGGYVCSGSYKAFPSKCSVDEAGSGAAPLRKLFSRQQREFYREHAPQGIELDDLAVLGPVFVLKAKGTPRGAKRKIAVECWLYPEGRILELSTRCAPDEAMQVAAETRAWCAEREIDLLGEQQTKTQTTLDYFAEHVV